MNRELLGALADELIPAGSGMPSASEAGVAGEYLDAALAARPDLAEPLEQALASVEGLAPGAAIAQLRGTNPEGWGVLTAIVPAAYFLNPEMPGRDRLSGARGAADRSRRAARLSGGRAARLRDRARTRLSAHP